MTRKWITLSLVRHGQSPSNVEPNRGQHTDEPLTAIGENQVDALGKEWANVAISHLYSSPYTRALSTAQAISRHNSAAPPIIQDYSLREQDYGDVVRTIPSWNVNKIRAVMTGQSYDFGYPPIRQHRPPGGGESYEDVAGRARRFLISLVHKHGAELDSDPDHERPTDQPVVEWFDKRTPHVAVVSHNIFLTELYEVMVYYDDPQSRRNTDFDLGNASFARFTVGLDEHDKDCPLKMFGLKNSSRF